VDGGWNPEAARVGSSGRRCGGLLIAAVGDGRVDGADAQEGARPHVTSTGGRPWSSWTP
jgi:hypothetical protein